MSSDSDENARRRLRGRGREFGAKEDDDWPTMGSAPSAPVVKGAWGKGSASAWVAQKKEVAVPVAVKEKTPGEGELVPLPCVGVWKRVGKKEVPAAVEEEKMVPAAVEFRQETVKLPGKCSHSDKSMTKN